LIRKDFRRGDDRHFGPFALGCHGRDGKGEGFSGADVATEEGVHGSFCAQRIGDGNNRRRLIACHLDVLRYGREHILYVRVGDVDLRGSGRISGVGDESPVRKPNDAKAYGRVDVFEAVFYAVGFVQFSRKSRTDVTGGA